NQEVGGDRVPADAGEAEVGRLQLALHFLAVGDVVLGNWLEEVHQAYVLDYKIQDVGQGEIQNSAIGGIHLDKVSDQQHCHRERHPDHDFN
ncbi:hypothetical protein QN356_26060, partial [Pseudomonas sp. CCC3.1]